MRQLMKYRRNRDDKKNVNSFQLKVTRKFCRSCHIYTFIIQGMVVYKILSHNHMNKNYLLTEISINEGHIAGFPLQ